MYTVLRLFDCKGNELTNAGSFLYDPNGGAYSQLDYVFTSGGTYYIGVSGDSNYNYDPTVGGSGFYGWSTGDYRLDMTLSIPVKDSVGDTLADAQATGLGNNGKKAYNTNQKTIGDGWYGAKDVDLYQFQADAGQTLTSLVSFPKGSTLGGVTIRLFDSSGNEIGNSYGYSQLDWLFDTPGTYYLGISGVYNSGYDPNVGGSGSGSPTGDYTLALNLFDPKREKNKNITPSVRGHGTALPPDGSEKAGNHLDSVHVNAWLDANGAVHGSVVWTLSHNSPTGPGDPHNGAYPWYMKVDTLQFYGNAAYIEATVVRSPQSKGDVGTRVAFWIYDNGNGQQVQDYYILGASSNYWWWNLQPIKGNFTVRGG
jgi:hypothetical protein